VVFGRVPWPRVINRIIPGDRGGGQWVPVGQNSGWDNLGPRTFRGVCLHIMEGTLDGTDAYFRNEARTRALTDFGIGWGSKGSVNGIARYDIYQWNSMASGRAPWASGPANGVEGDGQAFISAYGVNAINRDLRSIEFAGRESQGELPSAQVDLGVALIAALADGDQVRYDAWPFRNGVPLIMAHREFSTKTCPGWWLMSQVSSISDRVGEILERYQTGME
jgi:hypothetical protein